MPEGPIIHILKEQALQFKGRKVIKASCNNGAIDANELEGETITEFKTWGKHFLICFPKFTIRVHLMMFGSYRINDYNDKPPRLHIKFKDGELNFYASELKRIDEPLDEIYDWTTDVMNPKWDGKKAIEKMKEQPGLLACDALMDQQLFSGVGNIIKNEVLFRTRIHPLSLVEQLPADKLKEMITEAVNYSFDFLKWKKQGTFNKHWLAYQQETCPRDHVPFHKKDIGKSRRTSFFCNICQLQYGESATPVKSKKKRLPQT